MLCDCSAGDLLPRDLPPDLARRIHPEVDGQDSHRSLHNGRGAGFPLQVSSSGFQLRWRHFSSGRLFCIINVGITKHVVDLLVELNILHASAMLTDCVYAIYHGTHWDMRTGRLPHISQSYIQLYRYIY